MLPHELLSSVDDRVCGFDSPTLVLLDNRCFFLSLRYKYAPLLRVTILLVFLDIRKKVEWNGLGNMWGFWIKAGLRGNHGHCEAGKLQSGRDGRRNHDLLLLLTFVTVTFQLNLFEAVYSFLYLLTQNLLEHFDPMMSSILFTLKKYFF